MSLPRSLAAATALAAIALGSAAAAPPLGRTTDDCVAAGADDAARALVADHAYVEDVGEVAGLTVATAIDPFIPPGIPTALLEVDDRWCSVEHFNAAAAEGLRGADASDVATAFASVAATTYLGDVTVSDVAVDGAIVNLTTTGGRHGAVSDWTVTVVGAEVTAATFTTTRWAPPADLDASAGGLEGITSLPGHSRSFLRAADGRVVIDATVADLVERAALEREAALANAAELAGLAPGDDLAHTFEDGLTIHVSYGMSPYTPDTGVDTGVKHADRLRTVLAGVVSKYSDFLSWGASNPFDNTSRTFLGTETGLPAADGYINIDSPITPVCLACAYLTDAMEVHIAFFFPEIAPLVVPINYPDTEAFMVGVIGHEMVHSLQGGYSSGDGGVFTSALIEGSARASESLHADAHNSHQTGSIHYVDNGNGCEGFENGRGGWVNAQANGPFVGHTYDACYFWWTYFAEHGPEALVWLLEAMPEAIASSEGNAAARNQRLLDLASPVEDGALDLARWGAAAAAGSDANGYTIAAGDSGDAFDWLALMAPAIRSQDLQPSQSVSVANSGVRAYVAQASGTITALPEGGAAYVFTIVDRELVPRPAIAGTEVAAGDIVTIVAPGESAVNGTLSVA